eukprot:TRINITY_DN25001_c0_g1_i1.p1 TRINITY_DN25001_c0_g1~~TRINITY_DN25001_c0_g1_i1.p1  ORF type:complete len:435 (+),score=123.56 TRINITY_DN25001_c0_g1_i1:60-1364(+)
MSDSHPSRRCSILGSESRDGSLVCSTDEVVVAGDEILLSEKESVGDAIQNATIPIRESATVTPSVQSEHSRHVSIAAECVKDDITTQQSSAIEPPTPTPSPFLYREGSSLPEGSEAVEAVTVNVDSISTQQQPVAPLPEDTSSQLLSTTVISQDDSEKQELREQLRQMQLRCESMERMLQDTSNDSKIKHLTEQLGIRAERVKVLEGQNAKQAKTLKKNEKVIRNLEEQVSSLREKNKQMELHLSNQTGGGAPTTPAAVVQPQQQQHYQQQQQQQVRRASTAASLPRVDSKTIKTASTVPNYGIPQQRNSQLVTMVHDLQGQLNRAQDAIIASAGDAFEEAVADSVEQILDPESPRRNCIVAQPPPPPSRAEQYAMEALQRLEGSTKSVPEFSHSRYLFSETPLSPWRKRHTEPEPFSYFLPCSGVSVGPRGLR